MRTPICKLTHIVASLLTLGVMVWTAAGRADSSLEADTAASAPDTALTPDAINSDAATTKAGPSSPPDPATQRRIDEHLRAALEYYAMERWALAMQQFQRAHQLYENARTLRSMGLCAYNAADYPTAVVMLEGALQHPEHPLSITQRNQAADLIARAYEQLLRVRLVASPEPQQLIIDGHPPLRSSQRLLLLRPGAHVLTARSEGYQDTERIFSGAAGEIVEVDLDSAPLEVAVEPSSQAYPRSSAPSAWLQPVGVVAVVAGGLALGAAGYATLAANSRRATLRDVCPGGSCPPSEANKLTVYNRYRTAAMIGFYGGVGLAAVGTILLLIDAQQTEYNAAPPPTVAFGPGAITVQGGF